MTNRLDGSTAESFRAKCGDDLLHKQVAPLERFTSASRELRVAMMGGWKLRHFCAARASPERRKREQPRDVSVLKSLLIAHPLGFVQLIARRK